MDTVIERRCGLGVHKDTVVASARPQGKGDKRQTETRTFPAMTTDLLALRDWLVAMQVTFVGMESTGVCWKPVFDLLEDDLECWLLEGRLPLLSSLPVSDADTVMRRRAPRPLHTCRRVPDSRPKGPRPRSDTTISAPTGSRSDALMHTRAVRPNRSSPCLSCHHQPGMPEAAAARDGCR